MQHNNIIRQGDKVRKIQGKARQEKRQGKGPGKVGQGNKKVRQGKVRQGKAI
jgi:hypothetical protein